MQKDWKKYQSAQLLESPAPFQGRLFCHQNSIPQPTPLQCEENLSLKIKCLKVERENNALKHRVRQLEKALKENNLVFTGLRENPWETCNTTYNKIYRAISNIMTGTNKEKLEKAKKIGIINAIRIGKYKSDRGRPICVDSTVT